MKHAYTKEDFELTYRSNTEPWNYSKSGAEMLRYRKVLAIAQKFCPKPDTLMEVGCSLGLFSIMLKDYAARVVAIDISPTAIQKCKKTYAGSQIDFVCTTLSDGTFDAESFDIILYCDGIHGHELDDNEFQKVAQNIRYSLKKDGIVIFTDYLGHKNFDTYIKRIERFGFTILYKEYLHDRLWFQVKSWLKVFNGIGFVDRFLASERVAQRLATLSAKRGAKGSKHICVVAQPTR